MTTSTKLNKHLFTWIVCEDCGVKIMRDLQDHESLIIKCPAFAWGECCVCYNYMHFKITVQQDTQDWLKKFTFKKEVEELKQTVHSTDSEEKKR
ncbi:MAG: hypothetical protein O6761_05835 [Thaumarchaeota archaeon]|nr:hypothetical protein [Nitrososphaerota archaeon]